MHCGDKCKKYKKTSRDYNTENSHFCSNCDVFIEWDGYRCPCCKTKLKSKPRHSKRLRSYFSNNPEKEPKRH